MSRALLPAALCILLHLAHAQFLDVPSSLPQCQTVTLSWQPTSAPYTLSVVNSSTSVPLERLLPSSSPSAAWTADLPPGTSVLFVLQDGTGQAYDSTPLLVIPGSDECVDAAIMGSDTLLVNTEAPGTVTLSSLAVS
ncbi:hypothetical protein CALVIDRAFT_560529 [Calocera viscosa TUFC12733]|uniref:Uncharacterized protein n=1 Tax=Calocera viscosa (strain TUFC12733) TaxID=1330018 RepID=A0A167R557_CALVF|nr:hypothetical protein CALVIDRAFT_560529 [Calocera viscosa TUFC12733]